MRLLCVLLFTILAASTAAGADVVKAFPIRYELVQLTDKGETALTKGRALLVPGHTQPLDQQQAPAPAAANSSTDVTLHFSLGRSLSKEPGAPPRLILNTAVTITKAGTPQKVQVPGKPDSYIQGKKTNTMSYTNTSWRAKGDPTPIVLPFTRDGRSYRLTVMFLNP